MSVGCLFALADNPTFLAYRADVAVLHDPVDR
jgi:hypothetical protein